METLTYPAWMRHHLFWTLPLAVVLFLLGLVFWAGGDGMAYLLLGLALVLLLFYLLSVRRRSLEIALEPGESGTRGGLYRREDLQEVRLEPLWGRLRLRFGQGDLPLPLDLPGWDRALAHLGLSWQEVEGLEYHLLGLRGRHWLVDGRAYPPQEAEDVFLWGLGLYRHHMARVWKTVGVALLALAAALLCPSLAPLALGVVAIVLFLVPVFLLFVPRDLVGFKGSPGEFNPLLPVWRARMEKERRKGEKQA